MALTASRHRADRPRRPLRLEVLEDRATPAADIGFAMDMGIAPPGEGKAIATDPVGNVVFAGTVFTGKGKYPLRSSSPNLPPMALRSGRNRWRRTPTGISFAAWRPTLAETSM